jgi:hypothetical protein
VEFFFKLNALKISEITIFDVIVEEVAVLTSFLKVLLELSAFFSFITKTGNTSKYFAKNMKYQEILENSRKLFQEILMSHVKVFPDILRYFLLFSSIF